MKRVVITGVGPITPIGIGAKAFLEGQHAAKNGIRKITNFDASDLDVQIAGEVDIDISQWIGRKEARRLDRFVQFAMIGAALALEDAGLSETDVAGEHTGTSIGSGIGGLGTWEEQSKIRFERGAMRLSPFFIPMIISNLASGNVAMRYGLQGPSNTIVTACSTGAASIGDAFRTVQRGEAEIMVTGGAEAVITPMGIGGFAVMKALSTRNDSPETACRPFNKSRDGFVAGEGAGILILEEYERAKQRGARIYAEIIGYASSADAYHITSPAPEGEGIARCIRWALKDAHLDASQIGYINAHATSTPLGDQNEVIAFIKTVGSKDKLPPISATKSMTGHTLGAAGAIEAIASVQAICSNVLPPTRNYIDPDPEIDIDCIPNEAREAKVDYVLSTNFAFGGQNAALIFKRVD
jgi:3-oxoacyl-[acyl-carrier-protein] synthase II